MGDIWGIKQAGCGAKVRARIGRLNMKKYKKDAIGLGSAAIATGLMAGVVEESGGNAAPLQTLGSALKPAAGIMGASMVLDSLKGLNKKPKRRK